MQPPYISRVQPPKKEYRHRRIKHFVRLLIFRPMNLPEIRRIMSNRRSILNNMVWGNSEGDCFVLH